MFRLRLYDFMVKSYMFNVKSYDFTVNLYFPYKQHVFRAIERTLPVPKERIK